MPENLILVNRRNRAIGVAEKQAVHEAGLLHRAFSIFLIDERGRILLHRRHPKKYHSGGLWSNACCGHPRPGERTLRAARRRLGEELGATSHYSTAFGSGLRENEIVYLYFGAAPERMRPHPQEISGTAFVSLPELRQAILAHPEKYSFWLSFYVLRHSRALRRGVKAAARHAA